jgi:hypothetical protein
MMNLADDPPAVVEQRFGDCAPDALAGAGDECGPFVGHRPDSCLEQEHEAIQ